MGQKVPARAPPGKERREESLRESTMGSLSPGQVRRAAHPWRGTSERTDSGLRPVLRQQRPFLVSPSLLSVTSFRQLCVSTASGTMSRVQWSCPAVWCARRDERGGPGHPEHFSSWYFPTRNEAVVYRAVSLYGAPRLNSCVLLQVCIEVALKGQE